MTPDATGASAMLGASKSELAVTLDVDWAPDFAIDFAADALAAASVKATWFVTHLSPAIDRLRLRSDLFELGIHPNLLPGTTHGNTESDILKYCMAMVPEARSVRMHGLFQSSNLLKRIIDETPIKVDASLMLPHADRLSPIVNYWGRDQKLIRLPYIWEDDLEALHPRPTWSAARMLDGRSGLRIFDFHPIHVYLNSATLDNYRSLRTQGPMVALSQSDVDRHIREGVGTRTMFIDLVARLKRSGSATLWQIASEVTEQM